MVSPRHARLRGFTLLEVVVVLVVVGIVVAVGIPAYTSTNSGARDAAVRDALTQIARNAQAQAVQSRLDLPTAVQIADAAASQPTTPQGEGPASGYWSSVQDTQAGEGDYANQTAEVSFRVAETTAGLATLSETGHCVMVRIDGVRSYDAWVVKQSLGATCAGGAALAGPDGTYNPS